MNDVVSRTRPRRALSNLTNEPARQLVPKKRSLAKKKLFAGSRYDVHDLYTIIRTNESQYYACEDYIETRKQVAVSHQMRTVLMSWLVEVADEYDLCCQTIHLAVYLVDAFLGRHGPVRRADLQLVGITGLLIAAKYEEMNPPSPDDCSYITDYTYTARQVVAMEKVVLVAVQFRLSVVTSLEFRPHFQCEHPLVAYLLQLALLHPICLSYRPSQLAAGACAYARAVLGQPIWSAAVAARTGYEFEDIRPIAVQIQALHQRHFGRDCNRHRKVLDLVPVKRFPASI